MHLSLMGLFQIHTENFLWKMEIKLSMLNYYNKLTLLIGTKVIDISFLERFITIKTTISEHVLGIKSSISQPETFDCPTWDNLSFFVCIPCSW